MEVQIQTRIPSVMEDPSAQSVAKVYAVAYLDSAGGSGGEAAVEELVSFVDDVLTPQTQFDQLLRGSALGRDDKNLLIDRVVGTRATPLFANFLRVLAKHGRLDLLQGIRRQSEIEQERRAGKKRVGVSSATELSAESLASIKSSLTASLGLEPILETRIDPSLIGGVVIRVGDTVYDGSLKTQVKQLRVRLRERCLNEIQRGRDRFSHPEGN
ncbi:MAG: ATP synthase F1 subunit delta [Planctomycetota bacterium]